MPLDALDADELIASDLAPDFSQLSVDQLIRDPRIPNSFKDQVILRLQKVGLKVGLIKLSDFKRRDSHEEEAYRKAQEEILRRWLEAMQFRDLSWKLESQIQNEKTAVSKEIDAINVAINKLKAKPKGKGNAAKVENLKRARTELRTYQTELSGLEDDRVRARSLDDLQNVVNKAEKGNQRFNFIRNTARSNRVNQTQPKARTSNSIPLATTGSDETDNDDEEETGAAAGHAIIPPAPPPNNKPQANNHKQPPKKKKPQAGGTNNTPEPSGP